MAISEEIRNNVKRWLRREGGRYLKLGRLKPDGVIVHDEFSELKNALKRTKYNDRKYTSVIIKGRFQAEAILDRNARCVLLVGTGMGSAGSSIVIYELALQECKSPVLKVGTCVSTCRRGKQIGSVLLPRWAVADDGVVKWDQQDFAASSNARADIEKVFKGKEVVRADTSLIRRWSQYFRRRSLKVPANRLCAVWSADPFYQLLQRPDFFGELAEGYVIELESQDPYTQVKRIDRACKDDQAIQLRAWDMECAPLFSAGIAERLQVAAGLAVSWSSKHWCNVPNKGTSRRSTIVSAKAHAVERKLILAALDCLFA